MLRHSQAVFAIVFALFPLLGVWAWGWSAREVIILYWVENLILGLWQVMKMLTLKKASIKAKIITPLFFCFHFGSFCYVHGIFIITLTQANGTNADFSNPFHFYELLSQGALFAILSNTLMHGIRFFREHIQEGGRNNNQMGRLMAEPYKHIIIIHIAIIISGFIVTLYQSALPLLGFIVLGKLILDLKSIYQKKRLSNDTPKKVNQYL